MKIAFIIKEVQNQTTLVSKEHLVNMIASMAGAGHEIFLYTRDKFLVKEFNRSEKGKFVKISKLFQHDFLSNCFVFLASLHALRQNCEVIHFAGKEARVTNAMVKILKPKTVLVSMEKLQCPFFVKSRKYSKKAAADKLLAQYKLRDKKYALAVGNLTKQGGMHYLVEAFKQLENTSKTPNNFKLVLVGAGKIQEDYLEYLRTIIRGRANILLLEEQKKENLAGLFSRAYVFVQPAEVGATTESLLQAMAHGLAPLVSDVPENLEIVGQEGFIFKAKSVIDLRDKLAYILTRPDEIDKLGIKAKGKVRKDHGWDSIAQKTIDSYRQAIINFQS